MIDAQLTPEEKIVLEILTTFCTAFSVATTETTRRRVLTEAVRHATPLLLRYRNEFTPPTSTADSAKTPASA